MKLPAVLAALIAGVIAVPAGVYAQSIDTAVVDVPIVTVGQLEIAAPWARATAPGQKVSGVYFTIRNNSDKPISIVGASSPVAGKVALHSMDGKKGYPEMKTVDAIEIPAGKEVEFQPGSYHLMMQNLNTMLHVGKAYDVTLNFSDGTKADLKALIWDVGMVRVMK